MKNIESYYVLNINALPPPLKNAWNHFEKSKYLSNFVTDKVIAGRLHNEVRQPAGGKNSNNRTSLYITMKRFSTLLGLLMIALSAMPITPPDSPSPGRAKKKPSLKRTWQAGNFLDASSGKADTGTPVYELPFSDDFADGDATRANYTFIDLDNDGVENGPSSVSNKWFWKEDEKLVQHCVDGAHGNDWFITPAIHLDGKHLYKLTFDMNMGSASNLRVTIGTSTDPADHCEILDLNNIYSSWREAYSTEFSVEGEGNYYI